MTCLKAWEARLSERACSSAGLAQPWRNASSCSTGCRTPTQATHVSLQQSTQCMPLEWPEPPCPCWSPPIPNSSGSQPVERLMSGKAWSASLTSPTLAADAPGMGGSPYVCREQGRAGVCKPTK